MIGKMKKLSATRVHMFVYTSMQGLSCASAILHASLQPEGVSTVSEYKEELCQWVGRAKRLGFQVSSFAVTQKYRAFIFTSTSSYHYVASIAFRHAGRKM